MNMRRTIGRRLFTNSEVRDVTARMAFHPANEQRPCLAHDFPALFMGLIGIRTRRDGKELVRPAGAQPTDKLRLPTGRSSRAQPGPTPRLLDIGYRSGMLNKASGPTHRCTVQTSQSDHAAGVGSGPTSFFASARQAHTPAGLFFCDLDCCEKRHTSPRSALICALSATLCCNQ
jgi:hypothetical protein